MRRVLRRLRRGNDRGAVLVEAAFILPLAMLVVFATIEYGLYMSAAATTSSAAREGSRMGAVLYAPAASKAGVADQIRVRVQADLQGLISQDDPLTLWIYKADSNGFTQDHTTATCSTACYRYTWNSGSNTFVLDPTSPGWLAPDACLPGLDLIGVLVSTRHRFVSNVLANFTGTSSLVNEHSVSQLEPLPSSGC